MSDTNSALDFAALTEDDWRAQEERDEETIRQINNTFGQGGDDVLGKLASGGAIDQRGKADDAIDFEDIDLSDEDDLPDDEPSTNAATGDLPALTDDGGTSNDTDDLFGGDPGSSPLAGGLRSSPVPMDADDEIALGPPVDDTINFDHDNTQDRTNQDPNIPPCIPVEDGVDAVKRVFPGFEEHAILNWNELLRPKVATWISKKPNKAPRALIPTKPSLELEADQEKMFRIPGPASSTVYQRIREAEVRGLTSLEVPEPLEQADIEVFTFEEDSDSEPVGGFSLQDFVTVCADWDAAIAAAQASPVIQAIDTPGHPDNGLVKDEPNEDEDWDAMFLDEEPAPKRRKVEKFGLPAVPQFIAPSFDNFEEASAKLGKRVILDLNDPYLLIDDVESERAAKRRKVQHKTVRLASGKLGRELAQRFNFSNDAAYDALKENNQNRVRATLATIPVEHSMAAQRLSWPYYRVKLAASDPHSYHRPQLHPRKDAFHTIRFSRPTFQKRKALRTKKVSEVFKSSSDLSMNDNSTAILFEYCEEIPTVLSNFGMGQKIINYCRRTKGGGDTRPEKRELGESCILMPEDRSPFAIFGHVNSGEVVPTLHNHMFRAPIFKHSPRNTDFLVGRSSTGTHGSTWYIRNIDHLYVVGQTLPSMEVPGPHSRRVTNIAKNRLKMVAYRLLRKSNHVTLHDITQHVAESNESQNRQKLKEFLRFRKDTKDWALPEGEELMGETGIRTLVRPEEVCLLDAMQVGAHELENGGYEIGAAEMKDEDVEVPDELPPDALASRMAPWRLTKAFIDASHGKAMLAVHGAGDPTGKGLGISFLRTSMKGGYLEQLQGPLATSADAIERQRKANGGHMYNVKNQDQLYMEALTDIWNRQRESLVNQQLHDDDDVETREDEDVRFDGPGDLSQAAPTLAIADGMSQISQSQTDGLSRKKLKITREVRRENGEVQTITELVCDPVVIAQYVKKRRQQDLEGIE